MPFYSKKTKPGSGDHEASPSAGKNIGVILVQFCVWQCVPTVISDGVDIPRVPGCHLLRQMNSQRLAKVTSRIGVSINSQPIPF